MCESRTEAMQNIKKSLAAVIHKGKRNPAGNSGKVVQPCSSVSGAKVTAKKTQIVYKILGDFPN